jgi:hypothetical protein
MSGFRFTALAVIGVCGGVAWVGCSKSACTPGQSSACTCPSGAQGAQVCNASGSGFEACQCTGMMPDAGPGTDAGSVRIEGSAAKGPFIRGSTVTVAPVDAAGNPSGQLFPTETNDALGNFSLQVPLSGAALVSGTGYYFNELTGALSTSNLTLNAYATVGGGATQTVCVNLITQLTHDRVAHLMAGGATLPDAVTQAEHELGTALPLAGNPFGAGGVGIQMSLLTGTNAANAYLLATSAVFVQAANLAGPSDAQLQQLINDTALSFGTSGTIDSSTVANLRVAEQTVEPEAIRINVSSYFADGGSTLTVPDLDRALDSDLDSIANADDNCPLVSNPTQAAVNGVCAFRRVFSPGPVSTATGYLMAMLTADVSGDGYADVVIVIDGNVYVALNDGHGALGAPAVKATVSPNAAGSFFAADVDSDGKQDLVVGYSSWVYLRGDGAGGFAAAQDLSFPFASYFPDGGAVDAGATVPGTMAQYLAVGDVNGDGINDLVGDYTCDGCAYVEWGLGNGSFSGPVSIGLGSTSTQLIVADLNKDGFADVLGVDRGTGPIGPYVGLGSADGGVTLVASAAIPLFDGGIGVTGPAQLGDVDGDGHVDVLVPTSYSAIILFGDGSGAFSGAQNVASPAMGLNVLGTALADLTGDGKADIVLADVGSLYAVVASGRTLGVPASFPVMPFGTNYYRGGQFELAGVADLDHDGKADPVLVSFGWLQALLMNPAGYHSW